MNECRTCLSKNDLQPIFQSGIDVNLRSSELLTVTGVKIELNDGLTQLICDSCTKLINAALKLRKQSQNAEKHLRTKYKKSKVTNSESENSKDSNCYENSENYWRNATYNDLEFNEDTIDTYPSNVSEYIRNDLPNYDNTLDRLELSPVFENMDSSRKILTINDLESSESECNDVCDDNEWRISQFEKEKICKQKNAKQALSNAITSKCMALAVKPYSRHGPVKCKLCNKILKNVPIFKCHAKTHFEPEFSCEICGKKFVFNSVLRYHQQRVHGRTKRLACNHCAYRAVDWQQVQNHIRATHTGERPYTCDVCGDTFRMRSTIAQHMRTHFGVKNVQCERCPSMFRSRSELSWHRNKVHLMTYTYFCYLCPQVYKNLGSVKKHLLKIHGVPSGQHLPIKSVKELR